MEDLEQWQGTTLTKISVVIKYSWEALYWEAGEEGSLITIYK